MGVLQENNINLEKIADNLGYASADVLIRLDNEGETRLFNSVEECFEYLFIDDYKRIEEVREVMLKMASMEGGKFEGKVAEHFIEGQNTTILEDGRVVFVWG